MNQFALRAGGSFQPSGRTGIGGTAIGLSDDPFSQFVQKASYVYQPAPRFDISSRGAPPANYSQVTAPSPARRADLVSGGAPVASYNQLTGPNGPASYLDTSGGVRPGAVPQMNAVEQARAQGQGGPPPGMGGRDPNDPRNAVLAAYGGR